MMRVEVSVLVVSWNTRTETQHCLDSLRATTDVVRYEVIVVDNGSLDGSAEMLAARDDVLLIRNAENRGFAAAVNQANARARGELVLLLNSDVRMRPGALAVLVRFLRDRPEAAGVAPLYLNPDGTIQQHYMRLPTFTSALALATGLRKMPGFRRAMRRYLMAEEDFTAPRQVEQPSASCLLLRRGVLNAHQVLDERLPIYFNDVLMARELALRGHHLWMTPDAAVTHTLGASTRLLGPAARSRHHLGGLVRYLQLTQPRWRVAVFRGVSFCDRVARRLLRVRGHLALRELGAALRGDVGPLPDGDQRDWVIMFSGVNWSVGCQRQHALARELASDRRVLFVDPPRRRPRWRFMARPVAPSVWQATSPSVLPFGRQLPLANRVNRRVASGIIRRWLDQRPADRVLWIDEDLAVRAVGRLGESAVVYDVADLDWTFTRPWNRRHLQRAARAALRVADLVVASSPALPERLPGTRRSPVVVANGCDPALFTVQGSVADWVARLPAPRLGYVGAVDTRALDGELLAAVARRRPEWTFVVVGASTRAARTALAGFPNIYLHDQIRLEEVPSVLRGCDVCLLPYRVGELIDYVQPKKLYEYLALGKPVVATPLPALTGLEAGLIHLAADAETFTTAIDQALHDEPCPSRLLARRAVAVANSWPVRGETLRKLLADLAEDGLR
ncbi:glycosyltransferase [Streptantibioticus ferralitis]|uniref:Glycosyltransferase n=1 Tax=Streptantibioticus ferralitis TaxID=236510 RepID=A0ABT5Z0U1_9ACTN|nr:glycosyltransferase [Streptantibioticus ferralitis]MDF2257451.1 glycosyltransferase [Streptantibioticus ferralitis]